MREEQTRILGWLSAVATALNAHAQDDDARDLARRALMLAKKVERRPT